jgi:L-threonylcarbamoyladenylate synthase
VVAFPTETSYGLAADPRNARAVARVYAIKDRPRSKPLPLVAASVAAVARVLTLAGAAAGIARKHWPGALTIILPLKRAARVGKRRLHGLSGKRDAAVRVPRSAWARAVADAAGGVVTSTSANLSGDAAIYAPRDIISAFASRPASKRPDLLLSAGTLKKRPPSTIIRMRRDTVEVIRQGSVRVRGAKNI